ncbi:MAG TPA: hypothetical protein VK034_28330 [Enhygromyxa sp.]|nr:hypothetical protein [Enhygromyxa sp.]
MSIALFLASPPEGDGYRQAVAAVEQGMLAINTDPGGGVETLRAALAGLHEHAPRLAADPDALELRTLAELALARALLAGGDRQAAAAAVDGALEGLGATALSVDQLGPSLGALVAERQQALAGRGSARLRVACAVPCRVYVDERTSTAAEAEGANLPLGEHRVWIEGEGAAPLRTKLTLADADATLTLAYPEAAAIAPDPQLIDATPELGRAGPVKRVAPRWAEVGSLVVGSAAVIAGAVLWALDSKCPRAADPNDVAACPQLYDTRTAGIALVSAGSATALLGGVMLAVDEARLGDRRGHQLALTWTTRF